MRQKSSTGISRIECCSCSLFVLYFFLQVGLREVRESLSKHMVLCWAVWFNQYWNGAARNNFQRCHFKAFELYQFQDQTTELRCADQMPEFGRHSLEPGKVDCNTSLVP
jgi:hypothetical protein